MPVGTRRVFPLSSWICFVLLLLLFLHWKHRLYTVSRRLKKRVHLLLGRTGVQFASWSGLYFVVHSLRLNGSCRTSCYDGNCTGLLFREKLVSGQPGGKPLCHPHATSEEHKTIPASPSAFAPCRHLARPMGRAPGSCSTPSALLPCGLEGGNLLLGYRGNGNTDSETLYWMARVSLTVGKDRGPYDNKTPAALCPLNTNDKLLCFRGAGSFWKATLCWQTKQMQGGDCCSHNQLVEAFFFPFLFFFFYYWEKIIEVEDVGTERVVHLNLILFPIRIWSFDKNGIISKIIMNILLQRCGVHSLIVTLFNQQRKKKRKKLLRLNQWGRLRLRNRTRKRRRKVLLCQWWYIIALLCWN